MGNKGPAADVVSAAVVEDIDPAVDVSVAAALNKDDKAVFTLTFTEELSSGGFDDFTIDDLTITGGTAAAADLSKPAEDEKPGGRSSTQSELHAIGYTRCGSDGWRRSDGYCRSTDKGCSW